MCSLDSLSLPPLILSKLKEADFLITTDIMQMKPSELCAASFLTLNESIEVLKQLSSYKTNSSGLIIPPFEAVNLKKLLECEEDTNHIVTFCESLDELLGGGIPLSTISEISGTPGIGKTQLCLQACVSVQLPHHCGGVEGEAIFIDTEGSFSTQRLKEMSVWAQRHIKHTLSSKDLREVNIEDLLRGIYYFRCQGCIELIAVVKNLPIFLTEHPKVKLIVIDSIAFHFRHDFKDMMSRTSLLCALTQDLIKQATKNKLAVILTNQMTTRVETDGTSQLVTALGETWGHCPTLRLCLFWDGAQRAAKLLKSPHMANSTIRFQVTSGGIRDKKESKKRKAEDT